MSESEEGKNSNESPDKLFSHIKEEFQTPRRRGSFTKNINKQEEMMVDEEFINAKQYFTSKKLKKKV